MTDTAEKPRLLTVDTSKNWSPVLEKRLRNRGIEYKQAQDVDDAIELLNSGDFTAVITDGLKGKWRTIVDEASELELGSVLLSGSSMAVSTAKTEGVAAFHSTSTLTKGGMDTIIKAAIRPPASV